MFIEVGMKMEMREVQELKARALMVSTDVGMEREVTEVQEANAP